MDDDRTTRRRVVTAGGLLGGLAVSGCLRLTQSETATSTTTPDSRTTTAKTSEPSEKETATSEDAAYPMGVTDEVVNERIVATHETELRGVSRTVETTHMEFDEQTAEFDGDGQQFVRTTAGLETYVEDEQLFQRVQPGSEPVYAYHPRLRSDYQPTVLSGVNVLRTLVRAGNFAPVGTQTVDGETQFLLEADDVVNQRPLEEGQVISRYFSESNLPFDSLSAEATVTADGIVTKMDATLASQAKSGQFAVNTDRIGSTSDTTPDWKGRAKAERATMDVTRSSDGAYLQLRHTGGQSIGVESDVTFGFGVYDTSDFYRNRYQGSISEGTTFYLYKTDETTATGKPKLGVSKDSRPSTEPPEPWASNGGVSIRVRELRLFEESFNE